MVIYQENVEYQSSKFGREVRKRIRVIREFIAFRLHEREAEKSMVLKGISNHMWLIVTQ